MADTENGAAAPADESSVKATEGEQATDPKDLQHVVLADDDAEPEEQEDEGDEDQEGEGEAKPGKKPSRSARLKAQRDKAFDRIADLERQLSTTRAAPATTGDNDDLKPPKEEDFKDNYLGFIQAQQNYEIRKAIRDEKARDVKAQESASAEADHRARMSAYNVRLDEVRERIPDFDKVMKVAADQDIRDDVRDLVLESEKGPLLAYWLAQNPDKVEELNRMHPVQAAKEIGRLEARIRGPQPRKATQAKPPPSSAPRGGANPPVSDPSKLSMEDYYKARESGAIS